MNKYIFYDCELQVVPRDCFLAFLSDAFFNEVSDLGYDLEKMEDDMVVFL